MGKSGKKIEVKVEAGYSGIPISTYLASLVSKIWQELDLLVEQGDSEKLSAIVEQDLVSLVTWGQDAGSLKIF